MRAPLVEAQQHRSIGIENLPEVIVRRRRLLLTKQRLIPLEAASNVGNADDCPCALHRDTFGRRLKPRFEPDTHARAAGRAAPLDRLAAGAECRVLNRRSEGLCILRNLDAFGEHAVP